MAVVLTCFWRRVYRKPKGQLRLEGCRETFEIPPSPACSEGTSGRGWTGSYVSLSAMISISQISYIRVMFSESSSPHLCLQNTFPPRHGPPLRRVRHAPHCARRQSECSTVSRGRLIIFSQLPRALVPFSHQPATFSTSAAVASGERASIPNDMQCPSCACG
ncbi:hypothetical protein BC834DRAFT_208435 [Gloeopeniophorella convolvens]|nr:hypothetical protein BC834DRAFT_208435 [Gloeopeniophorella convolvens]